MTAPSTLPNRKDVPIEQTWALDSIFATPADWEAACRRLEDLLPQITAFKGRLKEGPQTLLACIEKMETAGELTGMIFTYAGNSYSVNTADQDAAARSGQAQSLAANFSTATSFLDPELMAIGFPAIRRWITENESLAFFTHYVDTLERKAAHVRSADVEEVLAMSADALSSAFTSYSMLNNADLTFKPAVDSQGIEHEVGQSSLGGYLTSSDPELRRTAWQNYADSYLAYKNTYASILTTAIKKDVFYARSRGYASSLHASLEANFIPVEVFHNLITVFKENLPTWQRYWRLRKKALGLEVFHEYDIKAPLTKSKPVVPFKQAVDWICEGMAPLGEEYVKALRRGCLEDRWVDWARNRGKRQGAYSSGGHGSRPFIMMSYTDDLFSLSTLAHELGHSMHTYLTVENQRVLYGDYGLFVAETASNFNQATVRDYLFRTQTERDFQIALIEEAMSNYHRYFFIMPTLARFELEVHTREENGQPLGADIMTGILADFFHEGYGDEVEFDQPRIGITWAQFLHMYMNFYVYQYATGISAAHALSHNVTEGKPGAVDRYLNFLRSGGSQFPLDVLKSAGVDLTTPEPVRQAFAVLAGLVDRLESLL